MKETIKMSVKEIIDIFEKNRNEENIIGMQRYGIVANNAFGIKVDLIRSIAKKIKKDHNLAIELWDKGYHDARRLAPMIAVPGELTMELVDKWTYDFNSWDICDCCCMELYRYSDVAINRIEYWAEQSEEYVRRTAFSMLAVLAVKRKGNEYDDFFCNYFSLIKKYCIDERNFVMKAVNWAIRQIGKRNKKSIDVAIGLCNEILAENFDSKSARWIARSALRELYIIKKNYETK
jgi:3-methyladenine DNA glycosylase AlkD